jgi:MFS family permease
VSLVSFFQDTASEILYPVLPFFVTTVLGAPPAVLGLIEGVADGTAAAMRAVSGRLADLRRRRPIIGLGYTLSALGKLLLAPATVWPMVLASRLTDRVGKGLRGPPRDALIADETTPANRGRAFGLHRAADTAGAVVGPLVGLGLYTLLDHRFRPLFYVAVLPAAFSALLVLAIRERPHVAPPATERPWQVSGLPTRFWRVLAVLALFALVNFPDTLLLLRAKDLGLGFEGVVFAYVLYNLSYALLSYPAGVVSDRLSRRVVFAVGLVAFSVTYVGFGVTTTSAWVWVLLPVYGIYTALTDGVSRAWIADLVPAGERGTALGVHAAVSGVGLLVAGVWAGLAWHGTGRVPFLIAGTGALVAAATIGFGRRLLEPAAEPAPAG